MSMWRRQHVEPLVRLWDKEFNYVGRIPQRVQLEPWRWYFRRIRRTIWYRVTHWSIFTIAFGAIVGAALYFAATAHADTAQDQTFYQHLLAEGMTPGPNTVQTADDICDAVWGGMSPYEASAIVQGGNPTLTWNQAKAFTGWAITIYCPPASLGGRAV